MCVWLSYFHVVDGCLHCFSYAKLDFHATC